MNPRLLAIAALLAAQACARAPGPDVVLITVDTLRADHVGAYGFPGGVSPALDGLARRGVLFERSIAAAPRTAPSHATMMTSRWVREHSIGWGNGGTRLSGERTLAEDFAAAGYDTAAFVGNVTLTRKVGLDRGFAVYDDELPGAEPNRPGMFERTAALTAERALAWLGQGRGRPLFLWVHLQDPHGPYTPEDGPLALARPPDEEALPVLGSNRGEHGIPAYQMFGAERLPSEYRARYAGEVRSADRALGRIVAALEARGRPAIVLVTADHGESLGEDGWFFCHGFRTTPDQSWVPFVLVAPGLEPARRAEPVHHVDVRPTLLELAGLAVPDGCRGLALGPFLRARTAIPERTLYTDVGSELSAYRGGAFVRAEVSEVDEPGNFTCRRYAWRADGGFASEGSGEALRALIDEHAALQGVMAPADPPDAAMVERLRALGYVEPGGHADE